MAISHLHCCRAADLIKGARVALGLEPSSEENLDHRLKLKSNRSRQDR